MNWMEALVKTYDECSDKETGATGEYPLLPLHHTVRNIHIEIRISEKGDFISAKVLPKDVQPTVIPCTEDSENRTSGIAPHPLCDSIEYLTSNIGSYLTTPSDNDAKAKKPKTGAYTEYIKLLDDWFNSGCSNPKIIAVRDYLSKNTIISDLVGAGVLFTDETGKLVNKNRETSDYPIFRIAQTTEQQKAVVRWAVESRDDVMTDTWNDETIRQSWIDYCNSLNKDEGLDYITGKIVPLASKHPADIRRSGDKAKLITSNDKSGFTFRGRFTDSSQACGIGMDASLKMHSALKWLIRRQGYRWGELCIVTWTLSGEKVSNPVDDPLEWNQEDEQEIADTGIDNAIRINKRLRGYNSKILNETVFLMAIDSAVPGRMSILMFRDELGNDFVEKLERWQDICGWKHTYAKDKNDPKKRVTFYGAPSPADIVKAAYGNRGDSQKKMEESSIMRILGCILNRSNMPGDIAEHAVRRYSNPLSFRGTAEWWITLSIACSIYNGSTGGKYKMTLEKDRKTRDYLYGRLLAMADLLESSALRKANEDRQTTAIRYMQRFSEFPYTTWADIELALVPYKARLGKMAAYYESEISKIMDMFNGDDFRNNKKLSGEFLLAYHCQKEEHYRGKKEDNKEEE